ncbi:hypothetical protein [Leuconostoc mesenteroides]|uniref:hypothetical protein n=1 Tax=Leuconostoc mesenteroides TaxID=1245 RepID=UPI00235EF2D2|nr:hypothetical protein [Leuconostoc mesenteroides]
MTNGDELIQAILNGAKNLETEDDVATVRYTLPDNIYNLKIDVSFERKSPDLGGDK